MAPGENASVLILYGEDGYRPCPGLSRDECRRRNAALGVSEEDKQMMLMGSMFGWEVPGVVAHFHGL